MEYGEVLDVPPDHLKPTTTASAGQLDHPESEPPAGLIKVVVVVEELKIAALEIGALKETNIKGAINKVITILERLRKRFSASMLSPSQLTK